MSTVDHQHPPLSRIERAFAAWARFVLRHRFLLLAMSVVFAGAAGTVFALRFTIDTENERLLAENDSLIALNEQLRDDYGQDLEFHLLVAGDVFSPQYLERLRELETAARALNLPLQSLGKRKRRIERPEPAQAVVADLDDEEGWGDEAGGTLFEEVTSLLSLQRVRPNGDGLAVREQLPEDPSASEVAALKQPWLSDDALVGRFLAKDGGHSVIFLRTDFLNAEDTSTVWDALEDLAARHSVEGFRVQVAGWPAFVSQTMRLLLEDLSILIVLSYLGLFFMLWWVFRHPVAMFGPVLAVGQAAAWTLGIMAWRGTPLTALTNILPTFLLCVGIGDAVHMMSAYRDLRAGGMEHRAAIERAIATTGVPVLFTSLTTAAGLGSFRFATAVAVQDLGNYGAIGVLLAMAETLLLVPIFLSFAPNTTLGLKSEQHGWVATLVAACQRLALSPKARRAVIAVSAALVPLTVWQAAQIEVTHDPIKWLPDDASSRLGVEAMDEHLGGSANVTLVVEPSGGRTMRDLQLLNALQKFEAHLVAFRDPRSDAPIVSNVVSVLDPLREGEAALRGSMQAVASLPGDQQRINDLFFLVTNGDREHVHRLMTIDGSRGRMIVRVKWLDAPLYAPLNAHIARGIDEYVGDLAQVRIAGTVPSMWLVGMSITQDLVSSFSSAVLVITVLMILMLGDIKLGLLAMVPNLLPMIVILGAMAALGIPLDMGTVINTSIAIGVIVDDTVHFMHRFKLGLAAGQDLDTAIASALHHGGRAMIITSTILAGGFCTYLAGQMLNLHRFGVVIILTVVAALVSDLVVAPALLRWSYGRGRTRSAQAGAALQGGAAE